MGTDAFLPGDRPRPPIPTSLWTVSPNCWQSQFQEKKKKNVSGSLGNSHQLSQKIRLGYLVQGQTVITPSSPPSQGPAGRHSFYQTFLQPGQQELAGVDDPNSTCPGDSIPACAH